MWDCRREAGRRRDRGSIQTVLRPGDRQAPEPPAAAATTAGDPSVPVPDQDQPAIAVVAPAAGGDSIAIEDEIAIADLGAGIIEAEQGGLGGPARPVGVVNMNRSGIDLAEADVISRGRDGEQVSLEGYRGPETISEYIRSGVWKDRLIGDPGAAVEAEDGDGTGAGGTRGAADGDDMTVDIRPLAEAIASDAVGKGQLLLEHESYA